MIKKLLLSTLIFIYMSPSMAQINIPQIGTAGVMGLSVEKEAALGDYFMRKSRAFLPIVDDPVLTEYVKTVGNKLVANAKGVRFPFEFFIVNDPTLNAAAFLGGKVKINTGLFTYSDNEDEFASVLAHEISHVTQRHIARSIEEQAKQRNLTVGSLIGAVALSILNPAAGMAALTTSVGASVQSRINYTRDNEFEADRIGTYLMYDAGFDPQGTVDLFKKLLDLQGNINPSFALLIDHPLSDVRVAEAQNRINQLPKVKPTVDKDFDFAKARVEVRYTDNDYHMLEKRLLSNVDKHNSNYQNYALALTYFELKEYQKAQEYLDKLTNSQNDLFIIDLKTDIYLATGQKQRAISYLQAKIKDKPNNQVLVINLANAYNENKDYTKSIKLLEKYLDSNPKDYLAYSFITDAYSSINDTCNALQSRASMNLLNANYSQSINLLRQATLSCTNKLTIERINAQISQIGAQRAFDDELNQS